MELSHGQAADRTDDVITKVVKPVGRKYGPLYNGRAGLGQGHGTRDSSD